MEKNEKNSIINDLFNSKVFIISMISVASLILLLLVFRLGVFVGFEKARFSYKWSDNYYRNFDGPRNNFNEMMPSPFSFNGDRFMNAHGVFGEIIKVDTNSIVIKDKNNIEKVVSIGSDTSIREFKKDIKITDLKINDKVVVIGEPDSTGNIIAKFIRILPDNMPNPPQDNTALPPANIDQNSLNK